MTLWCCHKNGRAITRPFSFRLVMPQFSRTPFGGRSRAAHGDVADHQAHGAGMHRHGLAVLDLAGRGSAPPADPAHASGSRASADARRRPDRSPCRRASRALPRRAAARSCDRPAASAGGAIWMSTMAPISDRFSRWNRMISSTRLRNSGRKCERTTPMTSSRTASVSWPSFWFTRYSEPRFEVMMMSVLRKSTVRPWPSVRRPSSSTCSRTLNTSGCAFSISSNSTT